MSQIVAICLKSANSAYSLTHSTAMPVPRPPHSVMHAHTTIASVCHAVCAMTWMRHAKKSCTMNATTPATIGSAASSQSP